MRAAATAGADAVKYQLVLADELAAPDYKHYDLFKSLEMRYPESDARRQEELLTIRDRLLEADS